MNKKGFTLVELLAVIIILAIVALVATPIILNVVEDSRKSAAKSEAAFIVSGINEYCATQAMRKQMNPTDTTITECGATLDLDTVKAAVDLGTASITGSVTMSGGRVSAATIVSNTYTVTVSGGSVGTASK